MTTSKLIVVGAALSLALFSCKKDKTPAASTAAPNSKAGNASASKPGTASASATSKPAASRPATAAGVPKTCDRTKFAKLALEQGTKVLGGVTLKESAKQGELLASTELYKGKKVRIEGPIVGICQGAGCWAAIKGPSGKHLNLKVKDGDVDFRAISKIGYYAVGEGVFTPLGHHGAQLKITGAMISKTRCQ